MTMLALKDNPSPKPWHIAVLVPARDEEVLLPRCLTSIRQACAALPDYVTSDIVVIADRCTDNTLSLARRLLQSHGLAVASSSGVVGRARALAADIAMTRYVGPLDHCWLANTDADCELPSTWLTDQLALAEQGIEAVAGIVCVDSFHDHPSHVVDRFRETYVVHPDGSHPHIHGANLGVRADIYRDVGGWQGIATGEDHDLWKRLKLHGCACRSVSKLEIVTSGRVVGRAPMGFAGALAAHDVMEKREVTT